MNIKELKGPIRAFMQAHYTDGRLAQLLCHARNGKLAYFSCCCFIGVATADHALEGDIGSAYSDVEHYRKAFSLEGAIEADRNFCWLASANKAFWDQPNNDIRRRMIIPMIRAEMKRREKLRATPSPTEGASCDVVHAEVVAKKI